MRAIAIWIVAVAGPASAAVYCPEPTANAFVTCVQLSRSVKDQRSCAVELRRDVEVWDKWEQCKLQELAEKHEAERASIVERASSRRQSLFAPLGILFQ